MSMSHAQLSLRIKRSANWQDRRSHHRNDEADAEVLSDKRQAAAVVKIMFNSSLFLLIRVTGVTANDFYSSITRST